MTQRQRFQTMARSAALTPVSAAVAALLLGAVALPAPAAAMTLQEALAAAYASNPSLEAERARVRAVDEQVPQALSGWRPQVSVSAQAGVERTDSNYGSASYTQPRSVGLEVVQPLFNGFRTQNGIAAAENAVRAARSELLSSEQQLLLDVVTAYMDVLRDLAVVDLNRNNEQVLGRQLEATNDRYRVGEITKTDVSQAESRLAGAVASRIAAEGQLQSSRATFERLVGLPAKDLEAVATLPELPASLADVVRAAEDGQPAVVGASYAAAAAQDQIKVVRGELLPSVSLQAGLTRAEESQTNGTTVDSASLLVVASVPLYQGGEVYSRLREAKHTAGQRQLEVDQARQSAREAAVQAWEALQTARAQIDSIKAQVEAARVALEGVQREAQVGARTVLDVLDAEQESLNAQVDLVSAERTYRLAVYQVLAATGQLSAAALGLPVQVYDPAVHYETVRDQWFGTSDAAEGDAARPSFTRTAGDQQ